jgi:hypothetical protein
VAHFASYTLLLAITAVLALGMAAQVTRYGDGDVTRHAAWEIMSAPCSSKE